MKKETYKIEFIIMLVTFMLLAISYLSMCVGAWVSNDLHVFAASAFPYSMPCLLDDIKFFVYNQNKVFKSKKIYLMHCCTLIITVIFLIVIAVFVAYNNNIVNMIAVVCTSLQAVKTLVKTIYFFKEMQTF